MRVINIEEINLVNMTKNIRRRERPQSHWLLFSLLILTGRYPSSLKRGGWFGDREVLSPTYSLKILTSLIGVNLTSAAEQLICWKAKLLSKMAPGSWMDRA